MLDAINLMVRQNLTLRQAAQQLGQDITPQEADWKVGGSLRPLAASDHTRKTLRQSDSKLLQVMI
jgi:hypothetical protein